MSEHEARQEGGTIMKRGITLLGALIVATIAVVAWGQGGDTSPLLLLAESQDLLSYPFVLGVAQTPLEQRLFVAALPGADVAVILRPMTEAEYGSFQVQAIAAEMIEQQMLAAAIFLPVVAPEDVAMLPDDLVVFLQRMVNWISGFDVFADAAALSGP
jgi:hypothetical protein